MCVIILSGTLCTREWSDLGAFLVLGTGQPYEIGICPPDPLEYYKQPSKTDIVSAHSVGTASYICSRVWLAADLAAKVSPSLAGVIVHAVDWQRLCVHCPGLLDADRQERQRSADAVSVTVRCRLLMRLHCRLSVLGREA
jgi:hypothetical protein